MAEDRVVGRDHLRDHVREMHAFAQRHVLLHHRSLTALLGHDQVPRMRDRR
jgi:hypothetical protein